MNKQLFYPSLSIQRYLFISEFIKNLENKNKLESFADLGCGDCRLLNYLKKFQFSLIQCIDINRDFVKSPYAEPKIMDCVLEREKPLAIQLYIGDFTKKDYRIKNIDIITCIEVIEHLNSESLELLVENIFDFIKPRFAIFTTPNFEYNVLLKDHDNEFKFRNPDHKFEFTRKEFEYWCNQLIDKYGDYSYELHGVGKLDTDVEFQYGFCTQIAIFTRKSAQTTLDIDLESNYEKNHELYATYKFG